MTLEPSSEPTSDIKYYICIPGLGYIHKQWRSEEPRFCTNSEKAKSWKQVASALSFGNRELASRIHIRWELWQKSDDELVPIIRPRALKQ